MGYPDGDDLGGYTIGRPLGRGGNATVYLAHRPHADAPVALKVLAEEHRDAGEFERLRREFAFASRFGRPHIIPVYEHGQYWLAMRYVDGGSAGRLDGQVRRLTALTQVASALDTLHRAGVVHCDVKPSNVLVFKDFSEHGAVLTDFGEAHSLAEDMSRRLARDVGGMSLDPARRITHQPAERVPRVQASLPYAPPEILLGRMPSAASDQYALACTAAELITGEPPFTATNPATLIYAQVYSSPPRFSERGGGLPRAFDMVLDRALAKDPDLRYQTCAQFIAALTATLN